MATSLQLIVALLLLNQLPPAENFNVIAQEKLVTATLGKAAKLTCYLNPATSAEHMEVRWYRSVLRPYVHLYENGKSDYNEQMQEFHGRTELLMENIIKGNVTLIIHDVRPSDEGLYNCFFVSSSSYNGAEQELKVKAIGLEPLTHIENYHQGEIMVSCQSKGWYPEPEVMWRRSDGAIVPLLNSQATVANGLFNIEASINVSSGFRFTCVITNTISNEVAQSSISISRNIFGTIQRSNTSRFVVLTASFVVTLIFLLVFVILFHSMEEKNNKEKELLRRMLQSIKVDITLDTGYHVYNGLCISYGGKSVVQNLPNREFGVLGLQELTSGRHYWVVNILRCWNGCIVGVADKSKLNPHLHIPSPQNGIYALWLWRGDFKYCKAPGDPLRIMVCLEIENRSISVFCGETKMLIHKRYFGECLRGRLCPFFRLSLGAEINFF
uniref:Butyrophilin subfamily 3 member A2 n=1 Tax=Xenopus tropicalis TaxID=8364 RepID=A0A6I8R0V0_XENTR